MIVPCYNAARTVGRALQSVLNQTRPPAEIIVVDDGSTDDLGVVLRRFGGRVRLMRKSNGGAASARNAGIEASAGEFISFLDADDYWEPHKLEAQLVAFDRFPEVGLVAGAFYIKEPGHQRRQAVTAGRFAIDRPQAFRSHLLAEAAIAICTSVVTVRSSLLGPSRFAEDLRTAEDRDLWIRLLSGTGAYFCSTPLATVVLNPGSLSRSDPDADYPFMLTCVSRNRHLLGTQAARKWQAEVYRRWASVHLDAGRVGKALPKAMRAATISPWSLAAWRTLGAVVVRGILRGSGS